MSEILSSGGLVKGTSLLRSPWVGFVLEAAAAPPKSAMSSGSERREVCVALRELSLELRWVCELLERLLCTKRDMFAVCRREVDRVWVWVC